MSSVWSNSPTQPVLHQLLAEMELATLPQSALPTGGLDCLLVFSFTFLICYSVALPVGNVHPHLVYVASLRRVVMVDPYLKTSPTSPQPLGLSGHPVDLQSARFVTINRKFLHLISIV